MRLVNALAVAPARIVMVAAAVAGADGISDDVVKIGVLTDMSGQFSHESGEGAVTAVEWRSRISAARFWASRSRSWSPIIRTSPTSPRHRAQMV